MRRNATIALQRSWFWVYVVIWVSLDALVAHIIPDDGSLAFIYLVMGVPGTLLAFALSRSARVVRWTFLAFVIPFAFLALSGAAYCFLVEYLPLL